MMNQCRKCIMPATYPGISINDQGICSLCLQYRPHHSYLGREKLAELLSSGKKTGAYDCVIPVSGGKDSTFIWYYAVRELGLSPIAVNYDSGFQVEIAKENMRNACRILGVPLLVVKSPGDIQRRLLRESLLMSARIGQLTRYCGNCEAILRTVPINVARAHAVPFVLWGSSPQESLSNEIYDHYRQIGKGRKVNPRRTLARIAHKLDVLRRDPWKIRRLPRKVYPYVGYHSIVYDILSIVQRLQLRFPIRYALRPNSIPPFTNTSPQFVHFFDYIPWDSMRNVRLLEAELHWRHPADRETRFDCLIHCFANYKWLTEYGISQDGVNFCNAIRDDAVDRDRVMARETSIRDTVQRDCQAVLDGIGLGDYKLPMVRDS